VTRVLAQALLSIQNAIIASNRGDGLSAFIEAVPMGVSANLCEAVAAMVEQANGADVSVTWARTRPAPVQRNRIEFVRSAGEILREAARQFRLREPRRDERIYGFVRMLRRPEVEAQGRVTIHALIDGKLQAVSTTLSREDYEIASKANVMQLPVMVSGDLEREGQRWSLVEPRDLSIIEDAEDG
jgi:hypothetical protein